jgi:DNA invertase Pin-like site-specific DNA recombinase
MSTWTPNSREEYRAAIGKLQPGDCIETERLGALAASAKELLDALEQIGARQADFVCRQERIDTRGEQGAQLFRLCAVLNALEQSGRREKQRRGIERAREEGKYRGRKPIAVDEELFDSVAALWQSGQISARQAMARLDLKPNTFYRRIKEREELKMKDYKKAERELKEEIREAAKQSRRDLDELKKQVRAEAKEIKKAADEKIELHDVEREMRRDRIRAEAEHHETVRQMKKDVENETRELKKMLENEG